MADRYWNQLNSYDASRCESGTTKHECTCRCGGILHGRSHHNFRVAIRKVLNEDGSMSRDQSISLAEQVLNEEEEHAS